METGKPNLIGLMKMHMTYANQRQVVLSKNVANADTPNYKVHDVQPLNFKQILQENVSLAMTSPMHLEGRLDKGPYRVLKQKNTFDTKPNGNNVVLEEQVMHLSENSADYQATTSIYKKIMAMLKSATGSHGGA